MHLPQFPHPQAARAARGRPLQGRPRLDRHGELPRGGPGPQAHSPAGRRCGDRSRSATEIPAKVAADKAYQNAMARDDRQNARIEHDRALERVIVEMLSDQTELFKQFMDNPGFRKWLADTVFTETYRNTAWQLTQGLELVRRAPSPLGMMAVSYVYVAQIAMGPACPRPSRPSGRPRATGGAPSSRPPK